MQNPFGMRFSGLREWARNLPTFGLLEPYNRLTLGDARYFMQMAGTIFVVCYPLALLAVANQNLAPTADGTIVDGGGYGQFDGVADSADWSFNQSSFEGAITLSKIPGGEVEHRLVFEFNLSAVNRQLPVVAGLGFRLRGASQFPAETAIVQVYSYPSDLAETLNDFSAGPSELLDEVELPAFHPATSFEINVSDQVNHALNSAAKRVAFRFQISNQNESAQAFLDALDSDPTTKPSLVIYDSLPGDFDHDSDIDLSDLAVIVSCLSGPGLTSLPGCSPCDLSGNGRVDLNDVRLFYERHSLYGQD